MKQNLTLFLACQRTIRCLLLIATGLLFSLQSTNAANVELKLHDPCNLFEYGKPVVFEVKTRQPALSGGAMKGTLTDFFGNVYPFEVPIPANSGKVFPLELGALNANYYKIALEVDAGSNSGKTDATFAVVRFNNRSREEVLKGDYRFGIKMGGGPRGFDHYLAMNTAAHLGLHWTRELYNRNIEELNRLPVKIIYKVEKIPEEAYDAERYGPIDEFKHRHFNYIKASIPLEKPYKAWLRNEIATLPPEHNTFEIWNEAWGKFPPEDFAQLCQWVREVIVEARPGAVIGPNLGTHREYDTEFIQAGGMEGMNALFLHPYSHPERGQVRSKVHGVRKFYEESLGRSIEFYATEYGSPNPPEGPRSNSTEEAVAALNVRRSLIFYVEGFKGFMPHLLAQREKDPAEKEHWYGHFRANYQPKPNLIVLANAARIIDGQRYVGDIFFQPDVGAYLFEKDGIYTLTLWTNASVSKDNNDPNVKEIEIPTGVEEVKAVDVVGREWQLPTPGGKVTLNVDGNMLYLIGVSPDLASQAYTTPRSDQWESGIYVRKEREAPRMPKPPTIDGALADGEWDTAARLRFLHHRIPIKDISGIGYIAWDDTHLYVAARVIDDSPYAVIEKTVTSENWYKLHRGAYLEEPVDSIGVYIGSQPKFQIPEFLSAHDTQFLFAPVSEEGGPIIAAVDNLTRKLEAVPGVEAAFAKTEDGWSVETAIPFSALKDFPEGPDRRIAFEMRLNDVDAGGSAATVSPPGAARNWFDDATLWSFLELVE